MLAEKDGLGNILVNAGKITSYQIQLISKAFGKKLGEILADNKLVIEEEIIDYIEQQTRIKNRLL